MRLNTDKQDGFNVPTHFYENFKPVREREGVLAFLPLVIFYVFVVFTETKRKKGAQGVRLESGAFYSRTPVLQRSNLNTKFSRRRLSREIVSRFNVYDELRLRYPSGIYIYLFLAREGRSNLSRFTIESA